MKILLFVILTISASAQLPPGIARRLNELNNREAAAAEKGRADIRSIRKAAAADLELHAADLVKANHIEDAATAKRIAAALNVGAEIPMADWIRGRVFVRDTEGKDDAKPFIVFAEDGKTCKLPWGEKGTVEAISERAITVGASGAKVYWRFNANRSSAAAMCSKFNNDVWLLKPAKAG